MYKQASKLGLRFATEKGNLSVEQLWDLSQTELSNSIKSVKKLLKQNTDDDELSFLGDTVVTDDVNKLRFELLKDVYLTKKKEAEELRTAKEDKARKQKIAEIIAEKKEGALRDKSIEELEQLMQ
jgi:hypothetical protein